MGSNASNQIYRLARANAAQGNSSRTKISAYLRSQNETGPQNGSKPSDRWEQEPQIMCKRWEPATRC
eukprot:18467-Heterococcus_DN1.PRE.2